MADDGGGVTPSPSAAAPTPDAAAEGDLAAFCTLTAQFDRQDGPPTNEQLAEVKRVRPDEVGADVDLVADAFLGADGDLGGVMGDPDVAASMQAIDDWTASNCPDVEVVASPVDPAFAEYCAASVALEEGIPTADQLRELLDLAPDAIAGPADAVGELLDAEGGNVGAVLADPDGQAAIEEIMAWEAANCGGGSDGPEDDGDVEPAAGAEVIPVVGVDFGYEGVPDVIAAGPVALEFTNEGDAIHEAILFELDGATVDERVAEAMELFENDGQEPDFFRGFAFRSPNEEEPRYINADLEPGDYALVCLIPGPGGASHLDLGMGHVFTVG